MQSKLEELINIINQKMTIDQIISDYIHLEKKGNNYIGLCPFHQDTNPSMSVSPAKGIFKCFSCGAGGNGITFVKNYKGISFIDALKEVAEKADVNWHDYLTEYKVKPLDPELELIYKINEEAIIFYKYNLEEFLSSNNSIHEYIKKRELTENLIDKFEIGYADKNSSLVAFLLKKGYKEEEIVKTGLVKNYEGKLQDYFINRLMFPIRDAYGKAIGFSGRIIAKSKYAKYLNTPDTKAFKKSNVMYNFHNAQSQISLKSYGVIVEGFMDVVAFEKIGISNVIATMGTAFTSQHLSLLKALTHKLILAFDNDVPGINTTIKTGKNLLKEKFDLFVMEFTDAKDIDEYIKLKSKEEILKDLSKAIKFIDFYKKQLYQSVDKNSIDFELIRKFLELLVNVDDDLATSFYINDLASNYAIDKVVLESQFKKLAEENKIKQLTSNQNSYSNGSSSNDSWVSAMVEQATIPFDEYQDDPTKTTNQVFKNSQSLLDEQRIIKIASLNFEIFSELNKLNYVFEDPFCKKIFGLLSTNYSTNKKVDISLIMKKLSEEEQAQFKTILKIDEQENKINQFLIQEGKEIVQKLELNHKQIQKMQLLAKIQEAKNSGDSEQVIFLTKTMRKL